MGIRDRLTAALEIPVRETVEEALARHAFVRPGEIEDLGVAIRAGRPAPADGAAIERLEAELGEIRARLAEGTGQIAALPAALVELRAVIEAAREASRQAADLAGRAATTAEAAADRISELEDR